MYEIDRTDSSGYLTSSDSDSFDITNEFEFKQEFVTNGYNRLIKAVRNGKYFVLKGLKEEFADKKLYQNLLKKEFDILLSLNHPYIVRCYSLEVVKGLGLCIVMDYIDGIPLDKFLQNTPPVQKNKELSNNCWR